MLTREDAVWYFREIKTAQGYISAIRADLRAVDSDGMPYLGYNDRCMAADEMWSEENTIRDARARLRGEEVSK